MAASFSLTRSLTCSTSSFPAGSAVLPSGPDAADIGVAGGQIAAIGAPGSLAAIGAGRVVDAAGQIVIPGGIDPHVHCGWPIADARHDRSIG